MTLRITRLNGEKILAVCDSFEFRSNQVSNWIRIKHNNATEIIHDIAAIKTEK